MRTIIRNFLSVMRRYKMATTLNILGLSVAFAAFMIIMMQVDFDRNFDRSHKDADKIFRVEMESPGGLFAIVSRPLSVAIIKSSPHILAGTIVKPVSMLAFETKEKGETNFYRESSVGVSGSLADVFTFDMVEGDAHALSDPQKAIIPLSLARKLFGDEPATGKLLHFSADVRWTVAGVYRDFPQNSSLANTIYFSIPESENLTSWGNWSYYLYIRLNDAANVDGLFENLKRTFDPAAAGASSYLSWENGEMKVRFTPLADLHFTNDVTYDQTPKSNRQAVLALEIIAFAILIIAGINYTNFSAALVPKRIRSINTQKVLGGSVRSIRLALLFEAMGICLASWMLGIWIMYMFGMSSLVELVDADLSLMQNLGIIAGTAGLAIALGIVAGAYPSWYLTSFPPALALKGNFGLSPQGKALRSFLITVQFIASFALIIGAMFMYLQNRFMLTSPLGYEKERMIVAEGNKGISNSLDAVRNSLKNIAEVDDITYAEFLLSSQDQYMGWGRKHNDREIQYQCIPVSTSFLDVLGIDVSEGRSFREEDGKGENPVAIFNEAARIQYDMKVGDKIDDIEVIGFIDDVKFASFRTAISPMAFHVWGKYVWGQEQPSPSDYIYIKVKAGADMRQAIEHVRAATEEYSGGYPLNVRFFNESLSQMYEKELKLAQLILLFSLTAIFISIVGVFGLVVFDSEYRKREIAIRKVFGSTTNQILTRFNRNYIRLLLISFIPAAPLAWYAIDKWMTNFAYKIPMHWWVYLCSFILISLLTVATVTFQNWKAANMNPAESVKE